jgi:hypothetical protein
MSWWGAAKDWMFGGAAGNNIPTKTQTGDYQRGYLQNDFMNRQAPMMDTGQNLATMLGRVADGSQQGAGELAVQRQIGNAQAQQTSTGQMARGANAAMAGRNAARMNSSIGVNGAGQAGIAQLNDVTNAQGQLAGVLGNMRAGDIQTAGANQQSQLAQQQLQLGALAQMLGVDTAELEAAIAKANANNADKGMFGQLLQVGGQVGAAAVQGKKTS